MTQQFQINDPRLWTDLIPRPNKDAHKYDRGHAVIFGADELMGATRLAASACSRIGAGLVTVLSNIATQSYRIALPADIMVRECCIDDLRYVTAILGGPGGISSSYSNMLYDAQPHISRVFDAAALSDELRGRTLGLNTVLTPHDGEFETVFGTLDGNRLEQCHHAARMANCIILRKGPKTIVTHPDGRSIENAAPNPYLAKAGTGDVLAGFVTGLLAQGMPAFEAASCAVWIHSEAARRLGAGLTACDLEFKVPEILKEIL